MAHTSPALCAHLNEDLFAGPARSDYEHDFAQRPWGAWYVLHVGEGFKVKRIEVQPRSRLSYQTHQHRSEHWVVVSGTATCVIDGRTTLAGPGECVHVDVGQAHRIANLGGEALVILEVQRGSYLGEDDIVRLEDDYGRSAVPLQTEY
jgi:mannose-6-phosphate isomerase-like protein (cupin superfamily)